MWVTQYWNIRTVWLAPVATIRPSREFGAAPLCRNTTNFRTNFRTDLGPLVTLAEFSKSSWIQQADDGPFWQYNCCRADLKRGDIIMFAMGSSCQERVDPQADRSLGGQFACAPMYYGVFSSIVEITKNGGCGRCFGDEKGSRNGFT